MMTAPQSYREVLKKKLSESIDANPSYSLRAMARQLKIAPSLLSDVIAGKRNLSSERAFAIADHLKFSKRQLEAFVLLVQIENAKSENLRSSLRAKLDLLHSGEKAKDVNPDLLKMLSAWYHVPIMELTQIPGVRLTPQTVSQIFGIKVDEAASAIDLLIQNGLIIESENSFFTKANWQQMFSSQIPNEGLRSFHEQMLSKAITAVTQQSPQEKLIGSETFAFSEDSLKEAADVIEDCFRHVLKIAERTTEPTSVYHLGIQLFRLTKERVVR